MYLSKNVFRYLTNKIHEELRASENKIESVEFELNNRSFSPISKGFRLHTLGEYKKQRELLLQVRSEIEAAARQMVEVGKTYTHAWEDGHGVAEYVVTAIEENVYHVLFSNGAKNTISFGSPMNFDSVEVVKDVPADLPTEEAPVSTLQLYDEMNGGDERKLLAYALFHGSYYDSGFGVNDLAASADTLEELRSLPQVKNCPEHLKYQIVESDTLRVIDEGHDDGLVIFDGKSVPLRF